MTSIVYTSPILEHPPAGGPALRIENSIRALAMVSSLHVVSRVRESRLGGKQAVSAFRKSCAAFIFSPSAVKRHASRSAPARFYRKIFGITAEKLLNLDADFLCSYALKIHADIMWFGYGNISFPLIELVRSRLPRAKIVCDTDSVWSRFILRALDVETAAERRRRIESEGNAKILEEKQSALMCDVTTAVSETDAEYYRHICANPAKIHIFSNGIDIDAYKEKPPAPTGFKRPAIFLGGTFGDETTPMGHAAHWLVRNVMPLVWEKHPDAHLYLVGLGSETHCEHLTGSRITCTGKIPSVLPYLCHAACSTVPLFFESGTRFKILESAACGVPIVSTTLGAEGIPLQHGRDCLIADTPADFAAAINYFLEPANSVTHMTENCRELIVRSYGIEALTREASAIIRYLREAPTSPREALAKPHDNRQPG